MTAADRTLTLLVVWATILIGTGAAQDSATAAASVDRVRILLEIGRLDEAIAVLRQRMASNPTDARTHSALGSAYYLAKRPSEAMTEWRQAVAVDSTYSVPRTNIANALTDAGQLDSAIAEHRRVIALDSTNPRGYIDLGAALERKGLLDEAIAQWKHAVAINPNSATAWYNLGVTYARQKGWPEAWNALITTTDISEWYPNGFEALAALSKDASSDLERRVREAPADTMAHYYLAYAFSYRHDWGKAMSEIDRAIALDPSRAVFHKAKGWFWSRQGHNEEAIKSYQDCIAGDSANWACHNLLGWSYNALGEPNRARDALLAAAHINPNVIGIQENLALAYLTSDSWEEAAAAGERALALGSTYPLARLNLAAAYFYLQKYDLAWWHARAVERMGHAPVRDFIRDLARHSPEPHW